MITAVLGAVTMFAFGAAIQPRPVARTVTQPAARRADVDRGRVRGLSIPHRRPRIGPEELATWCDAVARAVRGGSTLQHAVTTIQPPACAAEPLAPALLALERGVPLTRALAEIDSGSADLDLVLVVLRACAEHGGATAEPIDRAASALRQRAALAGERRTQSAQARLSAIVMTLLPGAMLCLLFITSASVRAIAVTPPGAGVIGVGAALNLAGWWWMRRLISGGSR